MLELHFGMSLQKGMEGADDALEGFPQRTVAWMVGPDNHHVIIRIVPKTAPLSDEFASAFIGIVILYDLRLLVTKVSPCDEVEL